MASTVSTFPWNLHSHSDFVLFNQAIQSQGPQDRNTHGGVI